MGMGWHREVYPAFCRKPDGEVMFSSIRCGKNASVSVPCLTGWWLGVRRRSAHGVYPLQVVGADASQPRFRQPGSDAQSLSRGYPPNWNGWLDDHA